MDQKDVKKWLLGLVSINSPMGRLDYFVSNVIVWFLFSIVTSILAIIFVFIMVKIFNSDLITIKVIFIPLACLLYVYMHYNLMARRLWHITEEKSKAATISFCLSVIYLAEFIPIIRYLALPVILIAEIILLFKPGCDIPEEDQY